MSKSIRFQHDYQILSLANNDSWYGVDPDTQKYCDFQMHAIVAHAEEESPNWATSHAFLVSAYTNDLLSDLYPSWRSQPYRGRISLNIS